MTQPVELATDRLVLRQWRDDDYELFAALNADPRVMAYFPAPLDRAASDAMADRCRALITERGWGFWAAELKADGQFVGFVGLHIPTHDLPFSPCIEIGWRLAFAHWGRGLATEAARAALRFGFESQGLPEIVAFTALGNRRSLAVMGRLGMVEDGEFEHPALPDDHPLRHHRLCRLSRSAWLAHHS